MVNEVPFTSMCEDTVSVAVALSVPAAAAAHSAVPIGQMEVPGKYSQHTPSAFWHGPAVPPTQWVHVVAGPAEGAAGDAGAGGRNALHSRVPMGHSSVLRLWSKHTPASDWQGPVEPSTHAGHTEEGSREGVSTKHSKEEGGQRREEASA